MDGHVLQSDPVTPSQVDELKDDLGLVKESYAGHWLRASVQVLWPEGPPSNLARQQQKLRRAYLYWSTAWKSQMQ